MALPATAVLEVRSTGSDTQCAGGFNPARAGTDYSQQDAAQATGTATSSTTTVTATTGIFTSAMVGNYITDGTTYKEITAYTSSTVVTVDSAPSWTAATVYVGGALASPGKASGISTVSGQKIWLRGGTYNLTSSTANVSGGVISLSSGVMLAGYSATRGDCDSVGVGTRPTLLADAALTGSSLYLAKQSSGSAFLRNVIIDGQRANTSTTDLLACGVAECYNVKVTRCYQGFATGVSVAVCCQILTNNFGTNVAASAVFVGCEADGNADNFRAGIAIGCISQNSQFCFHYMSAVINCSLYNFSTYGVYPDAAGVTSCVNTVATRPTTGAVAFQSGCRTINCATYNTTASTTSVPSLDLGLIALTVPPHVNAAGGDFRLNSTAGGGAACKSAGIPGAFPGLTSTIGYPDIGAVQSQAAGGGLLLPQTWDGGYNG